MTMFDFLLKMRAKTLLYSLQAGRFVVKKFSRAAWDAASGSGAQFFTRWFKLRTLFETAEFPGVNICAGSESISWGARRSSPKIHGKMASAANAVVGPGGK